MMGDGTTDDAPAAKVARRRHPHNRLTPVAVRHLNTPGQYADGNGLYLVVDDSGSKRWIWRGVIKAKDKRCDLGLGSARLVSLADAREKAGQLRRDARAGKDPLAERQRDRNPVPTFKKAAKEVHAAHATTFRNAKHKAQWIASLEQYAFPLLGDRLVDVIDAADVLKVLAPIWTTTPETARRVKQRIKVVFDWAKASGFRSGDNPTDGLTKVLPKHRGEKQHHAALPYIAVPAFIQAVRTADTSPSVRLALELLIVTATRTNEVLLATWSEVDLEAKVWTIPSTRMKAGREHRVPLSERAIELLKQAQVYAAGSRYVFPGRTAERPLSNMVFLMLLRRLQRTDITVHGFRSSFRDWAAERTNVARAVCEAALAHAVQDKTEAAYFRSDLFEQRRTLMGSWARFATAKPADVVSIGA